MVEKSKKKKWITIVAVIVILLVIIVVAASIQTSNNSSKTNPPTSPQIHMAFITAQDLTNITGKSWTTVTSATNLLQYSKGIVNLESKMYVCTATMVSTIDISIGQFNNQTNALNAYKTQFSGTSNASTGNYKGFQYRIITSITADWAILNCGNYTVVIEFAYGYYYETQVIHAQINAMES